MTTGFMGTGPLLPALTEGGHVDAAYTMFEQTGYLRSCICRCRRKQLCV